MSVLLITSLGNLYFDLFFKDCPLTTKNFLKLCKIKYYNNNLFYSVQKDFIAQSGSPENSDISPKNKSIYGLLDPKLNFFKSEISPKYQHNQKGLLCTANIGPDLNTSTFYITLTSNNLISLNNKHTIFGILTKGFDVLDKINDSYVDETNRPYRNIRIIHTIVFNDPFDDLEGMQKLIPEKSPVYKPDLTDNKHLEDDFDIDKFFKENDTEEKIKEKLREQESKNKAVMLELMEDLPNSNVKPPKNVLFVCRLNPVTQAKDLENIFGQFGEIKDCKIVRDKKTKQSLKYGFIEFAKIEDCENAYLNMDGALIDDYRIKIDFSQSVKRMGNGNKEQENKKNEKDKDKEEKEMIFENKNRYNKYKDKELHIMNDEIHYKFENNSYRNKRKNAQYVFENNSDKKDDKKEDKKEHKKIITENKQKLRDKDDISNSLSETISYHSSRKYSRSRSKEKHNYRYNDRNKRNHEYERDYREKKYKYKEYKYKDKYKK